MTFTTILGALFPVFGLIMIGFACGKVDLLGPRAFEVLNRFVISLALPVLTFRAIAHLKPSDLAVPWMVVAVVGGAFIIYPIGYFSERLSGRGRAEANIAGLVSCFSNTGFVGLPIALIALGPQSLAPVAVTMAIYSAIVFGIAVLLSEISAPEGGLAVGLRRAVSALSRSSLILLAVIGIAWSLLGLPLSGPFDVMLETLAAATAPCALVAIGLFIALPREHSAGVPVSRAVALKLIGHPLATAGLILLLPSMPPLWSATAILMAAMPSGASSFVLAGGAGRWAMELSAWTVTVSTSLAALTLIPILWMLKG